VTWFAAHPPEQRCLESALFSMVVETIAPDNQTGRISQRSTSSHCCESVRQPIAYRQPEYKE